MLLFARLVGAIALEGLVSLLKVGLFLCRRRSERARVHDLILGRRAALAAAGTLAATGTVAAVGALAIVSLSVLSGCKTFRAGEGLPPDPASSVRVGGSFPGSSFDEQLDDFFESARMLWSMDDARGSLEDDLRDFGASEPEALRETLEMLGW